MEIYTLELKYNNNGEEFKLHPSLFKLKNELILVDCGYQDSLPLIQTEMNKLGFSLDNLTSIFITHHDIDHIGGLYEIKEAFPHIRICSSAIEAPYVSGKKKSLRLLQAERLYPGLSPSEKIGARAFMSQLASVNPVEIDHIFQEQDYNHDSPIHIIPTPGHTPGHISLYQAQSKILIAGDALVLEKGIVALANPHYTLDLSQAISSLDELIKLEITALVCYHGGILKEMVSDQLLRLRDALQ